jgi:hypothetical protein
MVVKIPYIKQEYRPAMDKVIDAMVEAGVKANGDLNYILYKYFLTNIPISYNSIKNYCGELNECAEEIRRRVLSKYEEQKIIENSDI